MIVGVVVSGKVHLTEVARAAGSGTVDVHAAEKRLSRHLNSEHWDTSSLTNHLLALSSQRVDDNSLIVVDLTDVAKPSSLSFTTEGRENTKFFSVLCVFSGVIIPYSFLACSVNLLRRASKTSSRGVHPELTMT
jgi:hypothetical protein